MKDEGGSGSARIGTTVPKTLAAAPVLVAFCLFFACGDERGADRRTGLWVSEGYGLFFRVESDALEASELTAVSCIPAWRAERVHDSGAAWTFHGGFASGTETVRVVPGASDDLAVLTRSDDMAAMSLRRVPSAPVPCRAQMHDTPLSNYDVLWTTFAENYPFFALHGVDWDAVDRRFRPLVTMKTTPDELFEIFRQMLEPLRDSHVLLDVFAPGTPRGKDWLRTPLKEVWVHKPDPEPFDDADFERANHVIEANYIDGPMQTFCGRQVRFGRLRGGRIGYLGVLSFHQYSPDDDLPKALACMNAASDAIFSEAAGLQGLVIDIRSNGGGEDAIVLALASRFTTRRYLAFAKQARLTSSREVRFTPPDEIFVEPGPHPGYLGEAVLLTGRHSASAAETFVMAMMGRRPEVCRIGESTQGVFSDVLDRRLPNGWRLVLPNEVSATKDGTTFDVTGVPPDVKTPGFSRADAPAGRDPGLDRALAVLTSS